LGKIDAGASDMVKKPARAGNDNVGMLQFLNLRINSHATVNSYASDARLTPQGFDGLMNLFGQLTGGGDYQGANASGLTPHQAVEYRQSKCRRFTGAGLGQTHYITAIKYLRDCPSLNRGRGFITCRCDSRGNGGMKIKCFKVQ